MAIACHRLWSNSGASYTHRRILASLFSHQVPQLWSRSLFERGDSTACFRWVSTVAEYEMEKDCKEARRADDRNALAEAKKLGKKVHAAVKAQLAQEQAATSEAKKTEKLRVIAEQKAEKARLAAESKAKQAEARVRIYLKDSEA